MDFVADSLSNGQALRALTLVDNYSRESLAIEVDFSLTGKRVVEVLEQAAKRNGKPQVIKCDNGSEFISKAVDEWAYRKLASIRRGFSTFQRASHNAQLVTWVK